MKEIISRLKDSLGSNKAIIENIIGAFIVKGGSMLLTLFLLPAYIRFFGNQSVLGIWYTILSVLNWVLMFDLGIGSGLRNKLPNAFESKDEKYARKLISSTYFSTIVLVAVFGIVGSYIIWQLDWNQILNISCSDLSAIVLKKAIQIAFFGIMIQFILKLVTSILYAIQKSAYVNLLTLLSNLCIFFALHMMSPSSSEVNIIKMAYVNVFSVNLPLLITTIILFRGKLRRYYPSYRYIDRDAIREVLQIGIAILWLQVVFMVISSTNEFLISAFCSPADVIEYQVYFKIFNCIAAICSLGLIPIR